jgi:hypothetical protein
MANLNDLNASIRTLLDIQTGNRFPTQFGEAESAVASLIETLDNGDIETRYCVTNT